MKNLKTDLVIIGGGAAGMMAACAASDITDEIILLEPEKRLGRKLSITGKGRCNLTNNCDVKEFLDNVPQNGKFLYSALNRFSPRDAMDYFESMSVSLKTERGRRVFPVSDDANEVTDALKNKLLSSGVKVYKEKARNIIAEDGRVRRVITDQREITCNKVIIATGGVSYPGTGSKGDGHKIAKELGHTVSPLKPSLVPLVSDDGYCEKMQGFALKNVSLSVFDKENKLVYNAMGEMLFTHFGVSGPLVLSASAHMRDFNNNSYRLAIDLKPGLDEKTLDNRILRDFQEFNNRDFANALSKLAGRTMIPVLIELSGIPGDQKVNSITREQRMTLLKLFKAFPVNITGTRPIAEAIITSGGVDVKEINPRTMESKLIEGLYFAGEIIDVDAYTGGYNLQIAWSTGWLAGIS